MSQHTQEPGEEQRVFECSAVCLRRPVLQLYLHHRRTSGPQPVGRGQSLAAAAVCHGQHACHDGGHLVLQGVPRSTLGMFVSAF